MRSTTEDVNYIIPNGSVVGENNYASQALNKDQKNVDNLVIPSIGGPPKIGAASYDSNFLSRYKADSDK